MRTYLLLLVLLHCFRDAVAQDPPALEEQQLESIADTETEDDSYLQQWEQFRKNPVNLNSAAAAGLKELHLLSDLQVENLLAYRRLLGNLVDIYELQAIPSWDIGTIRRLLPFVTIASPVLTKENAGRLIKEGSHSLLLRAAQTVERSRGFDHSSGGTKYLGSPQKIFARYRYTYKNLLQWGLLGDKDAGEQFFRGAQSAGFDFYSFHLFARKLGLIESIAIGDFTVNMGQGLIQWQRLAFRKSAAVMAIKRQSVLLAPYSSAGEFNFFRGAGITLKKRNVEAGFFGSFRKLNANEVTDTVSGSHFITSLLESGYNRTTAEISDRHVVGQLTMGGNAKYIGKGWQAGINFIQYHFSLPVNKKDEPYNRYAFKGQQWRNASFEYSYTCRNFHFFGEAAIDQKFHKAILQGILMSADPRVDISVLYRNISKEYQAINANAFTESTSPSNEQGIYTGISIRPSDQWRIDAYADFFQFPWLKYLVDAPAYGKDFLVQLTFQPSRGSELYIRYKSETKQGNQPDNTTVTNYLISQSRQNLRVQAGYKINAAITFRNRAEWISNRSTREEGFLYFIDFFYKPLQKKYGGTFRLQYFETDSYDTRVYAYENDVLYNYSIPVFYDKGYRYYLNLDYDISKRMTCWIRWAQTLYSEKKSIGSGLDEIQGSSRSEIKWQLRYYF